MGTLGVYNKWHAATQRARKQEKRWTAVSVHNKPVITNGPDIFSELLSNDPRLAKKLCRYVGRVVPILATARLMIYDKQFIIEPSPNLATLAFLSATSC